MNDVYRIAYQEEGTDTWTVVPKRNNNQPRLYSTKGAAKGAAALLAYENDYRTRKGLVPLNFRVEKAPVEWEIVD